MTSHYELVVCLDRSTSDELPRRVNVRYRILTLSTCFLFFLFVYQPALTILRAQSATANLSGTVSDENGALLPAARISVLSLGQGFQRQALTNGEGTFVVPLLPPGTYLIKAEHEGFATAEVRDVILNVNDQVRLHIVMKVGRLNGQSV